MRSWILFLLVALLAAGCAPHKTVRPKGHPSGFASADAKNVHDFLMRYQQVIAGENPKAILNLYADKARMVPYLVENKRVLTKKDLQERLPSIVRAQRQADMRLALREPMDIAVTTSGERATVQALADLSWIDRGTPRHILLDCAFQLERVNYVWKVKESHQVMASPGQTTPSRVVPLASPAPKASPRTPDRQFSDTPPLF